MTSTMSADGLDVEVPAPAPRPPAHGTARSVGSGSTSRTLRSMLALAIPLLGLPVVAMPAAGPRQLFDVVDLVNGRVSADRANIVGALLLLSLWFAWVQLLACVVAESVSGWRNRGLPPLVRFATTRQQEWARRHVTVLLARLAPPAAWSTPSACLVDSPPDLGDGTSRDEAVGGDGPETDQEGHPAIRWDVAHAGLLAAGLLRTLHRTRRQYLRTRCLGQGVPVPDPDATAVEVAALLGADVDGASDVDAVLRWLSADLLIRGLPPLRVLAVRVAPRTVEVLLREPRDDVPAPARSADGGRRWIITRDVEVSTTVAAPPAPTLVSLGSDGIGLVLVDLEACQGVICVRGDRERVRSVVAAAAVGLLTHAWCSDVRLSLVGFGEVLRPLGGPNLLCFASVADALTRLTRAAPAAHDVLVLAAPPAADELAALVTRWQEGEVRAPFSVLVAGDVPSARWRFTLDERGVLDLGVLHHTLGALALSARSFTSLSRLVALSAPSAESAEAHGTTTSPDPETTIQRPPLVRPCDPEVIRVLLTLFGAPQAIGDVAPGSPASVEIAMFLAFRGSASLSELEDALWPRGIDPRERNERLRRAQWWLGLDGEGSPRLRSERGRLWLSPEVHTDWAVVVAGTSEESCAIVRHLLLLADSPWTPRPQQGYSWLAREPLTHRIEAYVADVCTVAAEQALGLGDSAQAMAIATAGLRVCSHSTPLWDVVEKATPPAERHLVRAARRQQSMCFIA